MHSTWTKKAACITRVISGRIFWDKRHDFYINTFLSHRPCWESQFFEIQSMKKRRWCVTIIYIATRIKIHTLLSCRELIATHKCICIVCTICFEDFCEKLKNIMGERGREKLTKISGKNGIETILYKNVS